MNTKLVKTHWLSGSPMEAGKLVFLSLAENIRPIWAANILSLVYDKSQARDQVIDETVEIARNPLRWKDGHQLFSKIRQQTLRWDSGTDFGLSGSKFQNMGYLLSLAELVAKVTYNATVPDDPFDEDSGWRIVSCLRAFVDHVWIDKDFDDAAWEATTRYS